MTQVLGKNIILNMINSRFKLKSKTAFVLSNSLLILIGSFILAISAQYKVPIGPVPITLQSMVVMLIATFYGWKLGAATVMTYWFEGILVGGIFSIFPWFANGSGFGYFIGSPSAGFLWGFLPMVVIIGRLATSSSGHTNFLRILMAIICGQIVLYLFGLVHAYILVMPFVDWMNTPTELLKIYLYPFIIGDFLKTMIATLITLYFVKKRMKSV